MSDPKDVAQVLNSLGNLLSSFPRHRWREAEEAYRQSLELRKDQTHRGQVLLSLANLLSKDHKRWGEAEAMYKQSLALRNNSADIAKVLTSWASSLLRLVKPDFDQAEQLATESLRIDRDNLWTVVLCNQILSTIYENKGNVDKAVKALDAALGAAQKMKKTDVEDKIRTRLAALKRRQ